MIVSNTSPIINLACIGQLDLLPALFGTLVIPPAVFHEIAVAIPDAPGAAARRMAPWIERKAIANPPLVATLRLELPLPGRARHRQAPDRFGLPPDPRIPGFATRPAHRTGAVLHQRALVSAADGLSDSRERVDKNRKYRPVRATCRSYRQVFGDPFRDVQRGERTGRVRPIAAASVHHHPCAAEPSLIPDCMRASHR